MRKRNTIMKKNYYAVFEAYNNRLKNRHDDKRIEND